MLIWWGRSLKVDKHWGSGVLVSGRKKLLMWIFLIKQKRISLGRRRSKKWIRFFCCCKIWALFDAFYHFLTNLVVCSLYLAIYKNLKEKNERLGSDHVIWGQIRDLKKIYMGRGQTDWSIYKLTSRLLDRISLRVHSLKILLPMTLQGLESCHLMVTLYLWLFFVCCLW